MEKFLKRFQILAAGICACLLSVQCSNDEKDNAGEDTKPQPPIVETLDISGQESGTAFAGGGSY